MALTPSELVQARLNIDGQTIAAQQQADRRPLTIAALV
jgi:hypothetical protein